ncbi:hypothetical protein O3P69_014827 [Scylla paramamosain]|uniref:Uncharacterized protein n=1 Tax=Scylla paramamosain TaxID=85552 RepID=A0AAW0TXZ8_SCYPA
MSVTVITMEADEAASRIDTTDIHFGVADWTIFVIMLAASVLIGVVSAVRDRGRSSTQEFLLGGRNMPPIAVAFSLLGGWVSAISILGKARSPGPDLSHLCGGHCFLPSSLLNIQNGRPDGRKQVPEREAGTTSGTKGSSLCYLIRSLITLYSHMGRTTLATRLTPSSSSKERVAHRRKLTPPRGGLNSQMRKHEECTGRHARQTRGEAKDRSTK